MHFPKLSLFLTLAAAAWLSGCASVSVKNERHRPELTPTKAPEKIYVMDFEAKPHTFQLPRKTEAQAGDVALLTSDLLATQTVKRLNQFVIPAERIQGRNLPNSGWLLRGNFDVVRSGSVPLRIVIGMGSGRSTMNTTVFVYDLATQHDATMKPFLTFQTEGGSGAEPGLVTIPLTGPVALPMLIYKVGSKTYSEANKGVSDDANRTSRMIAAALSEYLAQQGFIPPGSVLKAKRDWRSSFAIPQNPLRN